MTNVTFVDSKSGARVKCSERVLIEHFQCPQGFVHVGVWGDLSEKAGLFRFGPDAVCYGRCSAFVPSLKPESPLADALGHTKSSRHGVELPFDIAKAVSDLRCEKYLETENGTSRGKPVRRFVRTGYYVLRPVMPVSARRHLQRYYLRGWEKRPFPRWPVDTSVESALETTLR